MIEKFGDYYKAYTKEIPRANARATKLEEPSIPTSRFDLIDASTDSSDISVVNLTKSFKVLYAMPHQKMRKDEKESGTPDARASSGVP